MPQAFSIHETAAWIWQDQRAIQTEGTTVGDADHIEGDQMLERIYRAVTRRLFTRRLPPVVRSVRSKSLTYLDDAALVDLLEQVKRVEKRGRRGIMIEAGCALGGSAIVIASAKSTHRPFYVFDVFGMIPAPSDNDGNDAHERYRVIESGQSGGIQENQYYGYQENLLDRVTENFRRHGVAAESNNVHLIKGLFQDTLQVTEPVVLAHIDGDWYESVMTCLQRIEPHLIKNAVMIIDDYDAWSGCRRAVDEYFSDKKLHYEFIQKSRLHIVRK